MSFSASQRASFLTQLSQTPCDILIIGGGITGAGIALDASLRGLKVGLVEKKDFASGTSSRSTKLIHGGLRYLKQLEFKLVHETGTERAIIHKNAPHLVKPEDMLLPIIEGGTLGKIGTRLALWVYDTLADVDPEEQFQMLSEAETLESEPLFRKEGLKGGALYTEYRTDDARLTIEVIKTAVSKGATCVNYSEATALLYDKNGKICGAKVRNTLSGESYDIPAKIVVNAAGPWVDSLREKDNSLQGKRLHLTKGVHIVVNYNLLPIRQAVYFDALDGRMLFVVPRGEKVYIGTTDTNYTGEMHEPSVTKSDVDYLLTAVNRMFPSANIQIADIESSWAGLRPLIHEEGKSPSELSRKDEIFESASGLLSIAGGKLTGFRKMAERIVDMICEKLQNKAVCATDKQKLLGGDFANKSEISPYIKLLYGKYGKLQPSMKWIVYLVHLYGKQAEQILEIALNLQQKGETDEAACLKAEIQFSLANEMIVNVDDFLVRRTGKLFFDRLNTATIFPAVLAEMGQQLNWTVEEKVAQTQRWELLNANAVNFE